jgi:hypothetical protein
MNWADAMPGRRYKILYQIPGVQRLPRVAVMTFVSFERDKLAGDQVIMSLRPLSGTQNVKVRWIKRAEPTNESIQIPKIWRGGV